MSILALLGIKFPSSELSPSTLAWLRTLQSLIIGALTTAIVVGLTYATGNTALTVSGLFICIAKTFLDTFGHGLSKYLREANDTEAATIVDEATLLADAKLPDEIAQGQIGKAPPQP